MHSEKMYLEIISCFWTENKIENFYYIMFFKHIIICLKKI